MAYTSCLTDYVGLQGCGTTTPTSGVYVNSLYGVSLKAVELTADEEQVTFAGVWADVQQRASLRFFTLLRAELAKKYKLNGLQQSFNLTQTLGTLTTAAAAKYRGVFVDLDGFVTTQHLVKSNFQQINVQQIRVYLLAAVNTTVKIFDAINGTELYSSALTGAIGWNTIEVNQKFTKRKLFICYNATTVIGSELQVVSGIWNNDYHDGGCGCNSGCEGILYGGESAITTTVVESAITKATDVFGISPIFSVECTYDALVCNNKEIFLNAWLYLLGVELLNERLYTIRINKYTTIDRPLAEKLRVEFETTFQEEMTNAVSGIDLNLCDCCIECNADVQIKENFG